MLFLSACAKDQSFLAVTGRAMGERDLRVAIDRRSVNVFLRAVEQNRQRSDLRAARNQIVAHNDNPFVRFDDWLRSFQSR